MISPSLLRLFLTITILCAATLFGFGAVMLVAGTFDDGIPSVQPIVLSNSAPRSTGATPAEARATSPTTASSTFVTESVTTTTEAATSLTTAIQFGPQAPLSPPSSQVSAGGSSAPSPPPITTDVAGQTRGPAYRTVATAPPPQPIVQPADGDVDDVDEVDEVEVVDVESVDDAYDDDAYDDGS